MGAVLVILVLYWSPSLSASSVDEAVRKGFQAMQANDLRTAILYFEQALKLDPHNLAALSDLGLSLAGLGRFREASERFRILAKLQPSSAGNHYNLGLTLLNLGDPEGAEKAFRRALKLAPTHARAQAQLANSLLAQARAGNASKMLEAAEAYRKALPLNRQNPELRFNLAFTLARVGDEAGALSEYREVIRLDPGFPQAQFYLGITLFQLGSWEEAVKHLRAALAQGQNDFYVHYYLGSALLKTDDRDEAQRHLQTAAALNPEHPGVHFKMATLERALGHAPRASAELRLFKDLSARQDAKWRAEALEHAAINALEKGDLTQGISALTQAYEGNPNASSARNLALANLQSGNIAEARRFLQKALELAPQDAAAHNYFGLLEAREGNLELAEQHFERAAKVDPSSVDGLYNAGVAAAALGHYEKAIHWLRAALKRSDTSRIRESLALVLADSGLHEEAQREFETAQRSKIANPK